MGKLLKAGAEARHFLSQFRSLTKMAELLDDVSGLENEVTSLEKRKTVAEEELSDLGPKLKAEQDVFKSVIESTEAEREAAVLVKNTAISEASNIVSKANRSVSNQHKAEEEDLKALQLQLREEKASFKSWMVKANSSKDKILRDTSELQKALDNLRAKLL